MKIIIVENYPLAREGLKLIFEQDNEVDIVALARDCNHAIMLTKEYLPNVVVLNLHSGGVDGAYIIRSIKKFNGAIKTLVIATNLGSEMLTDIVNAGTDALLNADSTVATVINALKAIHGNLAVMDENLLKQAEMGIGLSSIKFTKREQFIIHSIATGKTNKEIACECGLKEGTIKNAVSRILQKTGAASRSHLVSIVLQDSK